MDSINQAMVYFETYGLWFLFIIVYLEYLNLPGLPAGIIMPAIGALVAQSKYNFLFVGSVLNECWKWYNIINFAIVI